MFLFPPSLVPFCETTLHKIAERRRLVIGVRVELFAHREHDGLRNETKILWMCFSLLLDYGGEILIKMSASTLKVQVIPFA